MKAKNCTGNHDRQMKDIKTAPVMVEILYQTEEVDSITDPKPLDLYGHSTGVEMSP